MFVTSALSCYGPGGRNTEALFAFRAWLSTASGAFINIGPSNGSLKLYKFSFTTMIYVLFTDSPFQKIKNWRFICLLMYRSVGGLTQSCTSHGIVPRACTCCGDGCKGKLHCTSANSNDKCDLKCPVCHRRLIWMQFYISSNRVRWPSYLHKAQSVRDSRFEPPYFRSSPLPASEVLVFCSQRFIRRCLDGIGV